MGVADVPMAVIRRYARAIADRFQPQKIILFGSDAYGMPHAESDVDILVIMPGKTSSPRPGRLIERLTRLLVHLIVRTAKNMECAYRKATGFSGRLSHAARSFMKSLTREWVGKVEDDYQAAHRLRELSRRFHHQICFHCQQSAEKTSSPSCRNEAFESIGRTTSRSC